MTSTDGDPTTLGDDAIAARLRHAPFEIVGRFQSASNATLLVRLTDVETPTLDPEATAIADLDGDHLAVCKPQRGEAPLWDFPTGTLWQREIAAYEVSRLLGWDLVPVTVAREDDDALGPSSLQQFVAHDPDDHYFSLIEVGDDLLGPAAPARTTEAGVVDQLRRLCLFDILINNADRKGGHVLLRRDGRVFGVDHGVAFHEEHKLRTVMWHFQDEPVDPQWRADVDAFGALLAEGSARTATLRRLLSPAEHLALLHRARIVANLDAFPAPIGDRPFPWPLL